MGNIWHMQLNLKDRVFLWQVYVGGLPLAANLKERGYTDGKCPRCKVRQETARHTFCFCPLVLEWWRQLRATVLSRTEINLSRIKFTFNLSSYAALEHAWLINHIRYWLFQVIWLSRNETLFTGQTHFAVGLPTQRLKSYLLEALVVDVRM